MLCIWPNSKRHLKQNPKNEKNSLAKTWYGIIDTQRDNAWLKKEQNKVSKSSPINHIAMTTYCLREFIRKPAH